jgi:hypothetical protein
MIISLQPGQPELRLRLTQPGPEGRRPGDPGQIRLVIRPPRAGYVMLSPIHRHGCWPGNEPRPERGPEDWPALVYPAFGLSEEGDLVFRFDDLLFRRPPGRYEGAVETTHGHVLAWLDLDLQSVPFNLERAQVVEVECGGEE